MTLVEWRVIEGVRHGLSNPAIAARCDLTIDAVKFHVSSALGKLGLSSRRELQKWSGVRTDSELAKSSQQSGHAVIALGQVARTTADVARTANWFRDVVGMDEIMRFDDMVFFDCGGVRLYLTAGKPAASSLLYFRVANIRAEVDRLAAAGVASRSAPHRIHVHQNHSEE